MSFTERVKRTPATKVYMRHPLLITILFSLLVHAALVLGLNSLWSYPSPSTSSTAVPIQLASQTGIQGPSPEALSPTDTVTETSRETSEFKSKTPPNHQPAPQAEQRSGTANQTTPEPAAEPNSTTDATPDPLVAKETHQPAVSQAPQSLTQSDALPETKPDEAEPQNQPNPEPPHPSEDEEPTAEKGKLKEQPTQNATPMSASKPESTDVTKEATLPDTATITPQSPSSPSAVTGSSDPERSEEATTLPPLVEPLDTPELHYPSLAKRRRQQGDVIVRGRINSEGRLMDAEILESSGHAALDESALAQAEEWQYRQPSEGRQDEWVRIPVQFRLR